MCIRRIAALCVALTFLPGAAIAQDDACDGIEVGAWCFNPGGYLRVGYTSVQADPNYTFIGRNDGFSIENARVSIRGAHAPSGVSFGLSIDGAADLGNRVNTPQSEVDVRLRDGFVRWDFLPYYLGLQAGQFRVPFAAEELRSTAKLLFPTRALAQTGVLVGRGFETRGLAIDRQVGAMLSSPGLVMFGDFGVGYYVMAFNGNGANQRLNDNRSLAVAARVELAYALPEDGLVTIGGAWMTNDRTVGEPPNLYDETDTSIAADLAFHAYGAHLRGQLTMRTTSYPTIGTDDREQMGWHVELGYTIPSLPIDITPAYRYATFDPWSAGGDGEGVDLSNFGLRYHTIGLRIDHALTIATISGLFAYTLTGEEEARELTNDRVEVIMQVAF